MFTFNDVTQLIVGSAAARRSEAKRINRMYKDVEANLKLVTEVTRASTQASSTRPLPIPTSRSHAIQDTGMGIAQTSTLHRALSTPAVASFAPNLLDGFKRTNSESQIVIPLPEMTGFGAYRRAANASTSWQLNHLEEKFKNDGDIIAKFLGDQPPMGIDANIWQEYRKKNAHKHKSRQASVHTYSSSRSPSSAASSVPVIDACSEYTDPATGTKVIRGFNISQSITISKTCSPASSGRESLAAIPEKKKRESITAFSKAQMRGEMKKAAFECAIASDESEDDDDDISDGDEENWEDME